MGSRFRLSHSQHPGLQPPSHYHHPLHFVSLRPSRNSTTGSFLQKTNSCKVGKTIAGGTRHPLVQTLGRIRWMQAHGPAALRHMPGLAVEAKSQHPDEAGCSLLDASRASADGRRPGGAGAKGSGACKWSKGGRHLSGRQPAACTPCQQLLAILAAIGEDARQTQRAGERGRQARSRVAIINRRCRQAPLRVVHCSIFIIRPAFRLSSRIRIRIAPHLLIPGKQEI